MMADRPRKLRNVDIVFVDHRKSGCLTEVRDQGGCGCCYAMASLSILEWVYCMKTRRRTEFSEQYLLDCGGTFGLNGCNGGHFAGAINFAINNVGLELLEDYPYQERTVVPTTTSCTPT